MNNDNNVVGIPTWAKGFYLAVSDFQETYGFEKLNPFSKSMGISEFSNVKKISAFRDSLIMEEELELIDAELDNNIVEIADALGDICYVILGSVWTFSSYDCSEYLVKLGLLQDRIAKYFTPEQFNDIFFRIHYSNMSKSCKTIDEVHATMAQEKYKDIKYAFTEKNGRYYIIVNEDFPEKGLMKGKLLKSINYSPANLEFVKDYEKV